MLWVNIWTGNTGKFVNNEGVIPSFRRPLSRVSSRPVYRDDLCFVFSSKILSMLIPIKKYDEQVPHPDEM